MALNVTLLDLTDQLRSEIGASANPAQSLNSVPYWQQVLRRTQKRLYEKRKWNYLYVNRDVEIPEGERYYAFPADLNYLEITDASVKFNTQWLGLGYGIGPQQYNCEDSDTGRASQPIRYWDHYENNQFEVWPVPLAAGQIIRFRGMKAIGNLVANDDRAILDDTLIVLFAAAEILERAEAPDAKSKALLANDHYLSLVKNDTKADPFILGGPIPPANQSYSGRCCDEIRVNRV
jgi:hypothetical protein